MPGKINTTNSKTAARIVALCEVLDAESAKHLMAWCNEDGIAEDGIAEDGEVSNLIFSAVINAQAQVFIVSCERGGMSLHDMRQAFEGIYKIRQEEGKHGRRVEPLDS